MSQSHHTHSAAELAYDENGAALPNQRYRAECSCGWISKRAWVHVDTADADARNHVDAGTRREATAEQARHAERYSPDTADILAAGRHRIPVERLAQSGKPLLALSTNHWQTVLDALWDASERYWNAHEDPYDHEQRRLQDAYADLVRQLTD